MIVYSKIEFMKEFKKIIDIGEQLRVRRERSRLTQKQLAKLAGLRSAGTVCNIERGRNFASLEVYQALVTALGGRFNVDVTIDFDESPN
jgi:transcriptional regulator with XRE-family HTH domain